MSRRSFSPIRHFRRVADLEPDRIRAVLDQAARYKREPIDDVLAGKSVALLFSKPSTRTRISFSVGISQLGGHELFLGERELQMRTSETIEDTARVFSRYVDAVVIRTFAQDDVDDFADAADIPVINALTDERHPCQALTDVFTFMEQFPNDAGDRVLTYLGDGNNVALSLAEAAALLGMSVCLAIPEGYDPPEDLWREIQDLVVPGGAHVWIERDPRVAVREASALYTDVWISMGQEEEEAKLRALEPYRIDAHLLASARPDAVVMHCLPAHRGMEITSEVMDGPRAVIFEQAENRLHVQKALLAALTRESEAEDDR